MRLFQREPRQTVLGRAMPNSRRVIAFAVCLFVLPLSLSAQRIVSEISGNFDTYGLAINTVTNKIYVVSEIDDDVVVIDGATNQITGTAPVGHGSGRPTINSVANKIYVPNSRDNTITVVDGVTLATGTVNVGLVPAAIGVNPVTNKIYVANADGNTVSVIDGNSLQVTATITVDEGPLAIAVNTTTNKIYVGNQRFYSNSTVTVIDGATNHTTTLALPYEAYFYTGPNSLMVNEATNQIYALSYIGLYDIDGSSNQVNLIGEWSEFCVENMAMNPVTNHMYGADCDGNVDDIDLSSGQTNQIYNGSENLYISVDTVKNRVYTLDPYDYIFTAIDLNTDIVTSIQALNDTEDALATNSNTNTTYFGANGGVTVVAGATPMQFVAAQPCRVLDTRNSGGPIQGGTSQTVQVTSSNCNIPAAASAYSLNVTLVPGGPVSYLTIWPTDQFRPTVSTMNSLDGRVKADAAIVSAGTLGGVNVYVSDTTNVVIDINGYFMPNGGATLAFYPLTPCRVFDTRNADGSLGGPFLKSGDERDFPMLESSCIPSGITPLAYSLNFTALPHQSGQSLGYLTVWPQGQSKPLVSTLNNPTATIVANAAVVPAGQDGKIAVFPSDDTDLVGDINGYFAAPGQGGLSLYSTRPCRVLDTRQNDGAFNGELTVNVQFSGCFAPAAAQAYVFNATVVPPESLGFLTLYPDGQNRPLASTLNAIDGAITSNMAVVPSTNGSIDAYASGLTQLILDISSYFAP
jgi:YVTN family beta-propeller protein